MKTETKENWDRNASRERKWLQKKPWGAIATHSVQQTSSS